MPAVESVGVADLPALMSEPLALAALDRAGAADLPAQLPAGPATYVGTPYTGDHNLSGGQWMEHVILGSGRVLAGPDGEAVELGPGDYVRYPGDVLHVFDALEPGTTGIIIMEHV